MVHPSEEGSDIPLLELQLQEYHHQTPESCIIGYFYFPLSSTPKEKLGMLAELEMMIVFVVLLYCDFVERLERRH